MTERQWGVWLVTEQDVDDLTRRAAMGGKEEQQIVRLAEMTISKLPIGCLMCERATNGADAAKIGIVKPHGLILAHETSLPGFVVCHECAAPQDADDRLLALVREKFKIDAQPVDAKRVLQ